MALVTHTEAAHTSLQDIGTRPLFFYPTSLSAITKPFGTFRQRTLSGRDKNPGPCLRLGVQRTCALSCSTRHCMSLSRTATYSHLVMQAPSSAFAFQSIQLCGPETEPS